MPFKGSKYEDRRDAAAEAKKALIERFKARPPADDPAVLARAAERKAIQEAREIRAAERARLKAEDDARRALEAAAAEEAEKRAAELAARDEAIRAERKAARDAKYAARKARK
jgi:hypothetical protein